MTDVFVAKHDGVVFLLHPAQLLLVHSDALFGLLHGCAPSFDSSLPMLRAATAGYGSCLVGLLWFTGQLYLLLIWQLGHLCGSHSVGRWCGTHQAWVKG